MNKIRVKIEKRFESKIYWRAFTKVVKPIFTDWHYAYWEHRDNYETDYYFVRFEWYITESELVRVRKICWEMIETITLRDEDSQKDYEREEFMLDDEDD